MKFSELRVGQPFRQGAPGKKYGKGGEFEDLIFTKLPEDERSLGDWCMCKSGEESNAWNGVNQVHFCPDSEVYPA